MREPLAAIDNTIVMNHLQPCMASKSEVSKPVQQLFPPPPPPCLTAPISPVPDPRSEKQGIVVVPIIIVVVCVFWGEILIGLLYAGCLIFIFQLETFNKKMVARCTVGLD